MPPAATLGWATFVTPRSTGTTTNEVMDAELFALLGSVAVVVAWAVVVNWVPRATPGSTCSTSVNVRVVPGLCVLWSADPPVCVNDVSDVLGGSVALIEADGAGSGPLLTWVS